MLELVAVLGTLLTVLATLKVRDEKDSRAKRMAARVDAQLELDGHEII